MCVANKNSKMIIMSIRIGNIRAITIEYSVIAQKYIYGSDDDEPEMIRSRRGSLRIMINALSIDSLHSRVESHLNWII